MRFSFQINFQCGLLFLEFLYRTIKLSDMFTVFFVTIKKMKELSEIVIKYLKIPILIVVIHAENCYMPSSIHFYYVNLFCSLAHSSRQFQSISIQIPIKNISFTRELREIIIFCVYDYTVSTMMVMVQEHFNPYLFMRHTTHIFI